MISKEDMMNMFFNDIAPQTHTGRVTINGFVFNIGFNLATSNTMLANDTSEENEYPYLIINDLDNFNDAMYEYLETALNSNSYDLSDYYDEGFSEEDFVKLFISFVWSNATYEDFENPVNFLKRYRSFSLDDTFDNYTEEQNLGYLENVNANLLVQKLKQSCNLETPNKMRFTFENDGCRYTLPDVLYGIEENEDGSKRAYIYAIQNKKENKSEENDEKKFQNRTKRKLYKVNDGVFDNEDDEYKQYIENDRQDEYYPENVSDVSPSAVIALTAFVGLLKNEGIDSISAPDFLPVRWFAKERAIEYKANSMRKNSSNDNDIENYIESKSLEHENIQLNLTEKFIRDFRRISYALGIEITDLPDSGNNFIKIEYEDVNDKCNNDFLKNILNTIDKSRDNGIDNQELQ